MRFNIPDDSGILAIVDPDAYQGFVHEDWTWDMMREHFRPEMRERRLLVWGTGMEHTWTIDVSFRPTATVGFREVAGSIEASRGRLLLTNYEALTMAAGFPDVTLPLDQEQANIIFVPPGLHDCRIVQLSDPDGDAPFDGSVGFICEFTPTVSARAPWGELPWHTV